MTAAPPPRRCARPRRRSASIRRGSRSSAQLPPYHTVTGFRIDPVVGWISPPFELRPDPYEVADAFEVPLHFVLDPENHRRQSYRRGPVTRAYYVVPYQGRFIWGATAGILVNLARVLRA